MRARVRSPGGRQDMLALYCQTFDVTRKESCFKASLAVVKAHLETLLERKEEYLHAEELAFFKNLQHEKRQHSYLLGRFAGKLALQDACRSETVDGVFIGSGVFNFPVVYGLKNKLQISLAHSGSISAALVFPEAYPMGIDLEVIDEETAENIIPHLTMHERSLLQYGMDRSLFACMLWTAKEALGKVLRTGLTTPLPILEIQQIETERQGFTCFFTNFFQYKAHVLFCGDTVLAIVYARDSEHHMDMNFINQFEWIVNDKRKSLV